jgi:heme exporter protein CcmD
MNGFWAMGGYAIYVWPAYGISFLGLAGAVLLTTRAYFHAKAQLAVLERRDS